MSDECTQERFERDVLEHVMTVEQDDGVCRRLLFAKPGTGFMSFRLITWPWCLCYTGDMGTFVFSRLEDMFKFFRTGRGINPGYWSEKLLATDRDGHLAYSADMFRERVSEWRKDWIQHGRADRTLSKAEACELYHAIKKDVIGAADDVEVQAYEAAADFEHRIGGRTYRLNDFWEVNLREFTYRFIWCCRALRWGIAKYDASKIEPVGGEGKE